MLQFIAHTGGTIMLILNRYPDQEIVIQGGITIKIMRCRGKNVTLGIEAPDHISVDRREIFNSKQQQPQTLKSTRYQGHCYV